MVRWGVWSIGALMLVVVGACGDSAGGMTPSGSAESIDPRVAATADVFADLDPEGPGCAVAVSHEGGVHLDEFGLADVGSATPITADTVFDIGSVSKQVTAGAIGLLVGRGSLGLDDDITTYVAGLGPYPEVITVADLVHHTSGLPDYVDLLDAEVDEVTTTADALEALATGAGQTQVDSGEEFEYSNTNYVLLASIVEAVGGRSFPDFVDSEVFEPLEMADSRVRDDQGTLDDGQATGYEELGEQDWAVAGSSWRQTGDGAVHATAEDLLAWTALFIGDGAPVGDLGSPAWLEFMTAPGEVADGDGGYGGGLEIATTDDGDQVLRHGGSWIGYGSALTMVPEIGTAAVVTCNIDGIDAEDRADELLAIWSS